MATNRAAEIRIEDTNGFWRIVRPEHLRQSTSGARWFRLRAASWASLRFHATGRADPEGRPILKADGPAIGTDAPGILSPAAFELLRPQGWKGPGDV
jgi:hypothetical protein